jgi:basic membrane lipoprotein Med (substrate-binding protein (PBP1-ABC) superfamily)
MSKKLFVVVTILMVAAMLLASCQKAAEPTAAPAAATEGKVKVFAAFATPIEEPWDGVIHQALQKAADAGEIDYTYTDNIGYSGDMERVLREICEKDKPNLIMGDGFGNEEAIRRVAADYPEIAFAFGSGYGPVEPNFSVFDNWIHEPGYLMGMYAGGLTKSNKIGIVGPYPVAEANRVINAFIAGAKEVNPDATFLISWINSWYDPAAAKEAAQAHIDNGADVIYGYPYGAIEPAAAAGLYTFGMMEDQNSLAPDYVVTSAVWNMTPTVDYLVKQIAAKSYTAMDLKDFSMFAKGGSLLAPLHGLESKIPAELVKLVTDKEEAIRTGAFRVDINEAIPQ